MFWQYEDMCMRRSLPDSSRSVDQIDCLAIAIAKLLLAVQTVQSTVTGRGKS